MDSKYGSVAGSLAAQCHGPVKAANRPPGLAHDKVRMRQGYVNESATDEKTVRKS